MITAIHSKMVRHELYDYVCPVLLTWFWPVKARRGEVIIVNQISVYNNSGANYGICYKGIKCHGEIHRINHSAAINTGVVQRWSADNYLIDGDELGVAITPNAVNDTVQISVQLIRFLDSEFDKLYRL